MNKLQQASLAIMRIAPLFPAAAGLIAGIVLDESLRFSVLAYVSMFVLSSLPAISGDVRRTIGPLLIFVAAMSVGGTLHLQAARGIPHSGIERYADASGRIVRVRGTVASEPQVLGDSPNPFAKWTYQGVRTAFLLEAESVEGAEGEIDVTGRLRVTIGDAVLDLRENEKVEVFGKLRTLSPPQNPGGFDWRGFQRRQGVTARMSCDHRLNVRRLGSEATQRRWMTWLRTTVRGLLTDDLATGTPEEVSLLEAMVLGHRSRFDRRLNEVFIRAGVIHFIAVSGVHVVIVMCFARLLCRRFARRGTTHVWAMMAAIVLYALVTEPRPPILRASVIGLFYCIACLIGRDRTCLNWISATVIALGIFDPNMLFDVGYQLSSAALLGVSYLTPALRESARIAWSFWVRVVLRRPFAESDDLLASWANSQKRVRLGVVRRILRSIARHVRTGLAISLAAWLAGLPIVSNVFGRFQPWGPVNSVILLPLISIVMLLGFIEVAVNAVAPSMSSAVGLPLLYLNSLLVRLVETLSSLPGASLTVSYPPWWLIIAYYVFLLAFVLRFPADVLIEQSPSPMRGHRTYRHPRLPRHVCPTALAALILCTVAWCRPVGNREQLRMAVLAVGRGSATVIELPDGRTILYDAGTSLPSDAGRNVIVPFLSHRGIRHVDRVYISHPNLDHFSGLPTLLDQIDTDAVIINPCFEPKSAPGSPSGHLLDLLSARGQSLQVLDTSMTTWDFGGVGFELLWPRGDCDPSLSANDESTVLRLSYAGRSILLTGDIEDRTQRALLARGDLHADVLLLPHHGSVRQSTAEFIRAVAPLAAIRSSNERTQQTLSGLNAALGDVPLYNTADVGAVEVVLDGEGVHIRTQWRAPE